MVCFATQVPVTCHVRETASVYAAEVDSVPEPSPDTDRIEALEEEIVFLAAHLHAAEHRFLTLIAEYDKRADVENLVGEAKREGLDAIPSSRFKNNYAYFQVVMLAYNIWRYLKMIAELSAKTESPTEKSEQHHGFSGIETNTVRIARLRLLMIAAKVVMSSNIDKVRYSIQDSRTPALMSFLKYLDKKRSQPKPWAGSILQAAIG